ncbi:MAG: lipoprotein-releasing system ATP-binding protein, partial [Bacteroidia bacterium]
HLLPEFTAVENVCIPAYIAKNSRQESEKRAQELLDFLGLSHRMQHKPNQLSGGEQQRVAVARALMNKPLVILADEPSGNLDTENANDLHQLFFDLRNEFKQTFVIVTHNEQLANSTDRKIVMKDGRLLN